MNIYEDVLKQQAINISNLSIAKDCFELKIHLIGNGIFEKNEYEKNEVDLERIKSEISIQKIKKQLRDKLKEFKETLELYEFAQED